MNITNASNFRANLYRLMDEVADEHIPLVITGRRSNVVMVSEEDWKAILETLYLTSISGFVESIEEAKKGPFFPESLLKW